MSMVENPAIALARTGAPVPFFAERYADAYRLELGEFVDAVRAGGAPPVDVTASIRAVEASLAAAQSLRESRAVTIAEIRGGSV
jgi:myo-inositol 2-dehydrogenase/D-chiro-inositol 1-dehydrogenase